MVALRPRRRATLAGHIYSLMRKDLQSYVSWFSFCPQFASSYKIDIILKALWNMNYIDDATSAVNLGLRLDLFGFLRAG